MNNLPRINADSRGSGKSNSLIAIVAGRRKARATSAEKNLSYVEDLLAM
jgi:hypothetical protein